MASIKETPSQTAGPYIHIGCLPDFAGLEQRRFGAPLGREMTAAPEAFELSIKILDGAGELVRDAMIEIWQASPDGEYSSDEFSGWGRGACDLETGDCTFKTLKPGPKGDQAPYINVWITARGINIGLTTRIYFPDEGEANSNDPVFRMAGERAATMIATRTNRGYTHEIRLQGDQETVFFDV